MAKKATIPPLPKPKKFKSKLGLGPRIKMSPLALLNVGRSGSGKVSSTKKFNKFGGGF